jgi:hypothetical protein
MLPFIVALLNLAPSLVGGFKTQGITVGKPLPAAPGVSIPLEEAASLIGTAGIDYVNFEQGQAVVLGTFSEDGKPATIVAFKNGGSAATALGL